MKIFNSMTRKKEEFIPIEEKIVKMYVCGPTVYNYIHLGNARAFVVFDVIRRYLEYKGYEVIFVQNFTDIDDKIIKKALEENVTVEEISQKYIKEAKIDLENLNIKKATYETYVTKEIDSIISMIEILIKKGYAYNINKSVYFNIEKFDDYGKLSKKDMEGLEVSPKIEKNKEKNDYRDFILWKPKKENEFYVNSPWGEGRPGWHIECSSIIKKYLGDTIDIHGGGEDLIFPHHENEIAQSNCANGKNLANYWMHNGFVNIDNEKMSKSKGNYFILRDIQKEFSYNVIRFYLITTHYKNNINFSIDALKSAENSFSRIKNFIKNLKFINEISTKNNFLDKELILLKKVDEFILNFEKSMDDDFNTSDAITHIFGLIKFINKHISNNSSKKFTLYIIEKFNKLLNVLGLVLDKEKNIEEIEIIEQLIKKRTEAKINKDFHLADKIRDDLLKKGIVIQDTIKGVKWYKR